MTGFDKGFVPEGEPGDPPEKNKAGDLIWIIVPVIIAAIIFIFVFYRQGPADNSTQLATQQNNNPQSNQANNPGLYQAPVTHNLPTGNAGGNPYASPQPSTSGNGSQPQPQAPASQSPY